jgi:hypothetical protein
VSTLELFFRLLAFVGGTILVVGFLGIGIAGIMGWLDKDDRG